MTSSINDNDGEDTSFKSLLARVDTGSDREPGSSGSPADPADPFVPDAEQVRRKLQEMARPLAPRPGAPAEPARADGPATRSWEDVAGGSVHASRNRLRVHRLAGVAASAAVALAGVEAMSWLRSPPPPATDAASAGLPSDAALEPEPALSLALAGAGEKAVAVHVMPVGAAPAPARPGIRLQVASHVWIRAGDSALLPVQVEAPGRPLERWTVVVSGLPSGAFLSAGTALPGGGWHVSTRSLEQLLVRLPRATDAAVALDLALHDADGNAQARAATTITPLPSPTPAPAPVEPPAVAARQVAELPVVTAPIVTDRVVVQPVAEPLVAAATAAALRLEPAVEQPRAAPTAAAPPPPRLSMDDDAALIERGRLRARAGDIAGARLLFMRAFDGGSGPAALLLGETYDPEVLAGLGVHGIRGDITKARQWYTRASELGVAVAVERLRALAGRSAQ